MTSTYRYIIYFYIFVSIFISLGIINNVKPKRKVVTFVITYWFFISPIISSRIYRATNPLAFITGNDWRFDWYFTMFLLITLLLNYFSSKNFKLLFKKPMIPYETYFYIYLVMVLLVTLYHISVGHIPQKYAGVRLFYIYQALVLYFVLIRFIDKDTIKCILKAILYMSIISAIICPIQFFFDTWFMRTDRIPRAFEGYQRAAGIFQTPYDHMFMATAGMFLVIFAVRNKVIKSFLIILFVFSIVLTFSRGNWLAFLLVVILYFVTIEKVLSKKLLKYIILLAFIWIFLFEAYTPDLSFISDNSMMEERVMSDTASPRLKYYTMVVYTILDEWIFGYGDVENNEVYYKWMFSAGGKSWALGYEGGIHNLVLEELYFRGVFVCLFLLIFFGSFFLYTNKNGISKNNYLYLIALYFTLSYFIYMQTAAAFLTAYCGVMVVFFMAMIAAVYHNDIDISEYTIFRGNKIEPAK